MIRAAWRYLAALVAGAVAVLAFAPFELWFLAFLSLAVFYGLLLDLGPIKGGLVGWFFGLGLFGSGVSWVWLSLAENGLTPFVASVAVFGFCAALAAYVAVAGFLTRLFGSKLMPLAFAGAWTLTEWLRGTLWTGFSWLGIGYVHAGTTAFQGYAPVLGIYGLSFVTALIAALLVEATMAWRSRRFRCLAASGAVIASLLVAGLVLNQIRYTSPDGKPVPVSLLQGNVPMDLKWGLQTIKQSQYLYWDMTLESKGKLILWPETGIPRYFDRLEIDYLDPVIRHLRENDMALISGVSVRDADYDTNPDYRAFNSLIGIDGETIQFYHKFHLVPFGEYIPQSFRWLVDAFLPMSDFTPATALKDPPRVMRFLGLTIAPSICYEDAFGEEMIEGVRQANLLVNVSNLAWFGDYLALEQHFQISRMRAVEFGRPMLSVTNTGVTGAIAPDGSVIGRLPPMTKGILEVTVSGYRGTTPYLDHGDGPIVILSSLAILFVLGFRAGEAICRKNRRRQAVVSNNHRH